MNPIAEKMPGLYALEEDSTDEPAGTGTEPIAKPLRDERRSCRCTVPQARQPCELEVGTNVLSASLLNESKDGFAILVDRVGWLKAGKKVVLRTDAGAFMVRIVYIKEVAPPRNAANKCDSWFRVGMKIRKRLRQ